MTEPTYELEAVAAAHLPARWKPDYARRWLVSRLNRHELRGVRYGRWDWKMKESDVEFMLRRYSNGTSAPTPAEEPESVADGLSERSRRRLRSAS